MKYFLFLSLFTLIAQTGRAATSHETLFINRGEIEAVDSNKFSYLAFNNSTSFYKDNVRIRLTVGDSLILMIVNNDSINHTFSCQSQITNQLPILPGDTGLYRFKFNQSGVFIFYDVNPELAYLGLGSMISVENNSNAHFFWNIKEHNKSWNDTIAKGYPINWATYYPDYFLINGNSNPDINNDPIARVTGNVGDTIYINIANTGKSIHSLHFHGYHGTLIYSSKDPNQQGRSKDTFPVYPMESIIVQIIPDKVGEYPVHDHNLVAVSGGNFYPNGMFLTMLIQ